ncbi:TCR/Tet family MFS transporter [Rhizobium sp. KVB221]|uniref:TCR/Tet family MFS transporter n=1 Tax=Rhizobium setariae TaxID=2801340 RepID=A0A936YKH4_9HYPH|nr:TCR/Tet family MFS transporter [Rhizobium setariae]MBL0371923.1 TCR/Tet family MFS transporter [Rhizobium setariae]
MIDEKRARRGLALVFVILLMDMMGIALIMPVMPAYLKELTGADVSHAAMEGGWLFLAYAAMQFFFGTFIGNLSDRFGRRPVLLFSVLTFAIDNLICALAGSYWVLFVGRVLAGISGASYATASAYVADISTDENRAKNFGLVGISFGVGFTLGPVIGGFLGEFGPRVPFYAAALIAFLNFVIALFLLPETLDEQHRRKFEWKRANPLGAIRQLRNYKGIGWVASVMFLFWLAHVVYPVAWPFVADYRYGWSQGMIGLSLGLFGVMSAVVMGLILPQLVKRYGEWRTAVIGLVFCVLAFLGYAFATEGWMVFVVIALCCIEGVTDPALRSISAAGVPPSAQGELQGAFTSLSSVTSIIGPLFFTSLFTGFSGPAAPIEFPGMPYFAAALMTVLGLAVFVWRVPNKVLNGLAQKAHQIH